MQHQITGETVQRVEITLEPGESVISQRANFAWIAGNIKISSSGTRSGIVGSMTRAFGIPTDLVNAYTCEGPDPATVTFVASATGKLAAFELKAKRSIVVSKSAFVTGSDTLKIEDQYRPDRDLLPGLSPDVFMTQRVIGPGTVIIEAAGDGFQHKLAVNEELKVSPGHVVMYEPTVSYAIDVLQGVTDPLFGGDGLLVGHLTGPGSIWLQSLPAINIAMRIRGSMGKNN